MSTLLGLTDPGVIEAIRAHALRVAQEAVSNARIMVRLAESTGETGRARYALNGAYVALENKLLPKMDLEWTQVRRMEATLNSIVARKAP